MPTIVTQPKKLVTPLDPAEEFRKMREARTSDLNQGTFNLLLKGDKGIGKTLAVATSCRYPLLIHSFDPGGTKHLKQEIASGKVIANTDFETEDKRKPTAYKIWEAEFDRLRQGDFFKHIGTYMVDSLTFWLDACYNEIAQQRSYKGTALAEDGQLIIKGWGILVNTMKSMIKLCTSLPCDFILTAHATKTKEEVSGKIITGLSVPPSMQIPVPALFDEYYYLILDPANKTKVGSDQIERVLQTGTTDRIVAGTRIGRDKFDLYERPDIKALLRKAGLPAEDKPLFA